MNEFKLFVQRLGLISIASILVALSSFILLPILTNNLTINEYGIWNQLNVTVRLMTGITTLGLSNAIMRFLPSLKENLKIQEEYYSLFFVVLLFSAISSFSIFLLANPIANALFDGNTNIVEFLSLIIFVSSLNYFVINFFRTSQEIKKYSIFLFLQTYLTVLFVIYLVISNYGILGAVIGYLISQIFIFLAMNLLIAKKIGIKFPKFRNIKEYLSFSLPFVPVGLSYWFVESSDKYVIGFFLGSAFVGYYSPGYMLGTIILMIVTPFPSMLLPEIAKHYDSGEIKKSKSYLNHSMKLFLLIAIPALFGISTLSKPLLILLTTPTIASESYLITPIIALGTLFYSIYVINSLLLSLTKKTKIISIIWIIAAIINLIGNILIVPQFGIIGSATVTLVTYITVFIFTLLYLRNYVKIGIDFDSKFILKSISSSIFMTLFIYFINPNGIIQILITIVISVIIYLTILFTLKGITSDEIAFIKKLINKQ